MNAETFLIILSGIPWTIAITVGAFTMGALLGIPLCAMRVSKSGILRYMATMIILILRSIPPIVWLFFLYFGIGSGYLQVGPIESSIIALGLITSANLAEIYRGALKSIHVGQWEASHALNMPRWSIFKDIMVPQLVRVILPSATSYMIGLLKDSAIASTVGVTEVAFQANFVSRRQFQGLEVFAVAGLFYILISLPIAAIARYTDGVMRAKVAR
ncbi:MULTISPECIES: amino acid ABC transporter permease [unclassified Rhizobium]|uniref:amino acid ABC transporter permease n=1 Tax=unclassified Rhizobium TaxID=2613769 RepID=UPI0006F470AF|nr:MULTISPECIES: amino acid ABC transporter permease [unclassified Rhizobium]KQV39383.1 amino acid ABC transporter permease [Rhizobium sp. Root1212]KRD35388.1 amino acid ABC transporter permease [Rhizobium sp. Root268]